MKRIMVLDDSKDLCKLMVNMLDEFGVTDVDCFNSYDDVAAVAANDLNYDLAFLDINLGLYSKSGIEVFKLLQDHHFKGKIVFFTGHARSYPLVKKALEHPNVSLLDKPADIMLIEKIVRSI